MPENKVLTLEDRLSSLKEDKGDSVSVDEIGGVVSALLEGSIHDPAAQDFSAEIRELLDYIDAAKDELSSMRPNSLSIVDIPNASDELNEVVKSTEGAASVIMDAADSLAEIAFSMEGENAEKLANWSTQLFEASSFQDLTGQRITKVARTLDNLEEKLQALATAIGDSFIEETEEEAFDNAGDVIDESALLHGPQSEGEGNSQDEIDALLASFD